MFTAITDWMPCGARKRRAVLSCDTEQGAIDARAFYNANTTQSMDISARMDRAVSLLRKFGASCRHEYDPE